MGRRHAEEDSEQGMLAALWNRYARPLQSSMGQVILAIGFLLLAGLAASYSWGRFQSQILSGDDYVVAAQDIHIPTLPPWIRTDLKAEAITSGSLERMTVQQKDLQRRVAAAFEMHPWVSAVRRVTTRYPAQVVVDLVYRRPIAMVEVEQGLYPVDPEGTLLPTAGFTAEEAANFPRIVVAKSAPTGTPGAAWGDARVHGAARIAQHLEKAWTRLHLTSIIAHPDHTGIAAPSTVYEIKTADQTSIIWGHGPGEEQAGEPRAERKVQRLLMFANQKGSLTVPPGKVINLMETDRLSIANRQDVNVGVGLQ